MRRPGYLGDADSYILKPKAASVVEKLKAPLAGIVKATQQKGEEKKVIRFTEPDEIAGMSKAEKENAPLEEELIAIPAIPASHPLYHDLSLLRSKIIAARKERIVRRKEIQERWRERPETLMRWFMDDNKDEKELTKLLNIWKENDQQENTKRNKSLDKLSKSQTSSLEQKLEQQKLSWAEEDARKRALRAADIFSKEIRQMKKYEQQEAEQLRADKLYGVFRPFFKWPERKKPQE